MEEIVNKVANSALEVFDLEDYYPKGIRVQIDISQWFLEGFLSSRVYVPLTRPDALFNCCFLVRELKSIIIVKGFSFIFRGFDE
jgi:hypothetical protein